jgi:hypothetical protein
MTTPERHPFLDDLAEDVLLTSSVLRSPVAGRDRVARIVKAGGSLYRRQTPTFFGTVEGHGLFDYDIELEGGVPAFGLVSFWRDDAGEVTHLHIAFSPLGAVLSIAEGLRDRLADDLGTELFL